MKAFNGYSTNPNPTEAGLEAAKMAGNAKSAKLVFAYTSCDYDVKKVIANVSTSITIEEQIKEALKLLLK